ncbi:hypothetical protein FVEN_g10244 [Fusarium venenatum]|uniref:ML-like domain-containing protein n=1 Tax=Fusarium venenatum TaxID=56646 RepID=A0A2L2SWU2_9HYPO|nr:uncharacterized protein FVRRES_06700 [Fusarium venenatum]KAG8351551.1 hypothetical protein FVEN_g10244 [Fusarium venenatum]CEI62264.1 unnamed protein product [Fusarium venenatum]
MHFASLFSTAIFALAGTAVAAPVSDTYFAKASVFAINKVENAYKSVQVPLGKLTHMEYQLTSLELRGVGFLLPDDQKVDPQDITCQMYKDEFGTQPGSAAFNMKTPAYVSLLNPVEFGWVLCYVNVNGA